MLLHVFAGQLDCHGDNLNTQDNPANLQSDVVAIPPAERVEPIETVRPEDEAGDRGDGGLANVEALLDKERQERKERAEDADARIGYVSLLNLALVKELSCADKHR